MIGLPIALAGCQTAGPTAGSRPVASDAPVIDQGYRQMYAAVETEPFPIGAVDLTKINSKFYRQVVRLPAEIDAEPGTLVVDPPNHYLYLVYEGGNAIRYGVGVGRDGFAWSGDATIKRKQEWPKWHPPKEMQARDENAAKWPNGMPGGPQNPLGARAMYLFQGNQDTLYRLHGTNQPWSIGKSLSSGCIRLLNQDILDLYSRVPIGTKVKVLGTAQPDPEAVYGASAAPARSADPVQRASVAPDGAAPVPPADVRG